MFNLMFYYSILFFVTLVPDPPSVRRVRVWFWNFVCIPSSIGSLDLSCITQHESRWNPFHYGAWYHFDDYSMGTRLLSICLRLDVVFMFACILFSLSCLLACFVRCCLATKCFQTLLELTSNKQDAVSMQPPASWRLNYPSRRPRKCVKWLVQWRSTANCSNFVFWFSWHDWFSQQLV